jgi:membrane protease YdiL (CAAX protease family)
MQESVVVEQKEKLQGVVSVGRALAMTFALFSALAYVIALILGPVLFFTTSQGLAEASRPLRGLPIDIFMLFSLPPIPLGINHGVLFLGMWVLFVLCVVAAALSSGGFLKSIRESLSTSIKVARTNFLFLMPLVASGLFTATILISEFQTTQGVQTGSLNFPSNTNPYYILLNLAYAPLNEEFAFRITTIGIPLAVVLLVSYRSHPRLAGFKKKAAFFLLTLFSPELAKAKVGHKTVAANGLLRGISVTEWALITVTSLMFGFAHFLAGSGWEIGKVTTACLAGFVFAIMYVSYGAYADILLHWFFNYYFTVLDMGSSAYGTGFSAFANVTELATLLAGGVAMVYFLLSWASNLGDNLSRRAVGMTTKPGI